MKLLFLDFDGVLNSDEFVTRRGPRPSDYYHMTTAQRAAWKLCPVLVARLNRIVRATGAKVVVSSSWRGMDAACITALPPVPNELQKVLKCAGWRHQLFGQTPDLAVPTKMAGPGGEDPTPIAPYRAVTRWTEIRAWMSSYRVGLLLENGRTLTPSAIESFCILDDDCMEDAPQANMVRTNFRVGLTDADADRAIAILGPLKDPAHWTVCPCLCHDAENVKKHDFDCCEGGWLKKPNGNGGKQH